MSSKNPIKQNLSDFKSFSKSSGLDGISAEYEFLNAHILCPNNIVPP